MNKSEQDAYDQGKFQAGIELMQLALKMVGAGEKNIHALAYERAQAIRILREVCAEYGDNDWEDYLSLPDIIEKHLAKHLWESD